METNLMDLPPVKQVQIKYSGYYFVLLIMFYSTLMFYSNVLYLNIWRLRSDSKDPHVACFILIVF